MQTESYVLPLWVSSCWRGSASSRTGARVAFDWQLSNARPLDFRLRMLSMVNLKEATRRGGSSLLIFTGRRFACSVRAALHPDLGPLEHHRSATDYSKLKPCAAVTSRTGSTWLPLFVYWSRESLSSGANSWIGREPRAHTATSPRSHPVQQITYSIVKS